MVGCLRTRVRKQPIIALYFESENELQFYNIETMVSHDKAQVIYIVDCATDDIRSRRLAEIMVDRNDFAKINHRF